jgi:hypothetical protein
MGAMKDYQLTLMEIEEQYEALQADDDVLERHLFTPVLQAAETVIDARPAGALPYPLDLVLYALRGAACELDELRKCWRAQGIRA